MSEPERLGKYEIKGALGKGAMGTVYKGFDPHIERYVAIKTIRKDMVDPDLAVQYMARFKNEARAAGSIVAARQPSSIFIACTRLAFIRPIASVSTPISSLLFVLNSPASILPRLT